MSSTEQNAALDSTTSKRPSRILSCLQCQQRKVKCDRQSPCANCIRSRMRCVPAPAPGPRQRRRRLQGQDVVGRLRYYEGLLRQNNIEFEPFHADPAVSHSQVPASGIDEGPVQAAKASSKSPAPSASGYSETVSETRDIWSAMNQRLQVNLHHDSSDSDQDDTVRLAEIRQAWNLFDSNDSLLFGVRDTFVNLPSLHPEQIQIFRLWQIFMENVNPLLQVVHAPSLQKRIIEATGNLSKADPDLIALMFSIYSMAIHSLSSAECQDAFGTSREYLLIRYQFGCQQALLDAEFPRTTSRDCLAALYMYLVSLKQEVHIQSLSSMLGVAVRIARRLNLHIESSYARSKCSPFEAELGRRLWWSLVTFDSRMCEIADHQGSVLDPTWDCKVLLNINDSDLRPDMKESPTDQGSFTDGIFVAVRSHISDFMRHSHAHLDFINPALKALAQRSQAHGDGRVSTLESYLEERYLKFCNLEIPLHFMTVMTTRAQIAKLYMVEHFAKPADTSPAGSEATLFHAAKLLDYDSMLITSPLSKRYEWFTNSHFPFTSWMYGLQELKLRPLTKGADQAWASMDRNYEARGMYPKPPSHPFFGLLMRAVSQAWESRETAYRQSGRIPALIPMIVDVKEKQARAAPPMAETSKARWNLETLSITDVISNHDSTLGDSLGDIMQPTYDSSEQAAVDMDLVAHEFLWE